MAASSAQYTNQPRVHRRIQIAVALAAAIAIVVGAWLAVSQTGFDALGQGGIHQNLLPRIGEPAPDFLTEDVLGNPVRLSDYRGQPVWLNFWGSWCPPCRAEMPEIQAAYEQLAPQGLVLLAVSVRESPLDALRYAAQNNATFYLLSDPDEQDTGQAYPLYNVPTHIFIDADGIVRSIILQDMDRDTAIQHGQAILAAAKR